MDPGEAPESLLSVWLDVSLSSRVDIALFCWDFIALLAKNCDPPADQCMELPTDVWHPLAIENMAF